MRFGAFAVADPSVELTNSALERGKDRLKPWERPKTGSGERAATSSLVLVGRVRGGGLLSSFGFTAQSVAISDYRSSD